MKGRQGELRTSSRILTGQSQHRSRRLCRCCPWHEGYCGESECPENLTGPETDMEVPDAMSTVQVNEVASVESKVSNYQEC